MSVKMSSVNGMPAETSDYFESDPFHIPDHNFNPENCGVSKILGRRIFKKSCGRIWMIIFEWMTLEARKIWLIFGSDPGHNKDHG